MSEFDNPEEVEKAFPREEWEWFPVRSGDEATRTMASLAFLSGDFVFGEARWFSNDKGVVLIRKSQLKTNQQHLKDVDELIENPPKKTPWYKRIFGLK